MPTYFDETTPAGSESASIGAGRIRAMKSDLDALISQIFSGVAPSIGGASTPLFLPGWVTNAMLATASVDTAQIKGSAVTAAQIAVGAVGSTQLASASVAPANLTSGFICPALSVPTSAIQPGALSTTDRDSPHPIVVDGYVKPSMLNFAFIEAAIGQYSGSNSVSAQVNNLTFQPTVLILSAGLNTHGIGLALAAEVVGGTSPIHASWYNVPMDTDAEGATGGVSWQSNGFIVNAVAWAFNVAGGTFGYLALKV